MAFELFCFVIGLLSLYIIFSRWRKVKGEVFDRPKCLPFLGSILDIDDANIHFKFSEYAEQFGELYKLIGETVFHDEKGRNIFLEEIQVEDFYLNSYVNSIMSMFPFIRYIPGRYRTEFLKAKAVNRKIVQKYFYDVKRTFVRGEFRGIIDVFVEEQIRQKEAEVEFFFTDEVIIAQVIDIIDAGITTTWSVLSNTMLILLNHPQYQKMLQNEFASEYKNLTLIIGNSWYIHHNKEIWGDPWTFRPERFFDEDGHLLPLEHTLRKNLIPLGNGLRQCSGESFAKTLYFPFVSNLLQRWSFEFIEGKHISCDPRHSENFDFSVVIRPNTFDCIAKEQM